MNNSLSPAGAGFLKGVFAALFGVALVLAVFAGLADRVLLTPSAYQQAVRDAGLPERLPGLLADALVQAPPEESAAAGALRYFGPEDARALVEQVVTPAWAGEQADRLASELFAYLRQGEQPLALPVSLAEIKANLVGEDIPAVLQQLMQDWPPCTTAQLFDITTRAFTGQLEGLPACRPPEAAQALLQPLLGLLTQQLARSLPETFDLARLIPGPLGEGPLPTGPRMMIASLPWWPFAALVLGLALALAALATSGWRSALRWVGRTIAAAGGVGVLLSLLALALLLLNWLPGALAGWLPLGERLALELATVVGLVWRSAMLSGGAVFLAMLAAGLGLAWAGRE